MRKNQAIRFSNAMKSPGTNTTIFSCDLYIITTKFWGHFGIFTTLAKGLSASQQLRKLHKHAITLEFDELFACSCEKFLVPPPQIEPYSDTTFYPNN